MRLHRALRVWALGGFLLAAPLAAAPEPPVSALERAGLSGVRALSGGAITGRLSGETGSEIVLSARCGQGSNACDLVLATLADLARAPRRHRLVVVFLRDSGEAPEPGEVGLGPADRALVHLHVGRTAALRPRIRILPDLGRGPEALTPGWIVHALLRAGDAAGWSSRVADPRAPWLTQLVLRAAWLRPPGEGVAPDWGIPAAELAAPEVDRGSAVLATAVRRLDRLEGRPIPEDRYLAVFGRVWLRRDLCWSGLLLWALLVFRAGRLSREEPLRRPAFLFRALLLVAIFAAPVFSALLYPTAVLALSPAPRKKGGWILRAALALLPSLLLLAALAAAFAKGPVEGLRPLGPAALLVPATLGAYLWLIFPRTPRG